MFHYNSEYVPRTYLNEMSKWLTNILKKVTDVPLIRKKEKKKAPVCYHDCKTKFYVDLVTRNMLTKSILQTMSNNHKI